MNNLTRVTLFGFRDIIRSKWVLVYTLFFFVVTEGLIQLGGQTPKAMLSLINISLILIPLVSILFGTMYFYNSREFVELLLTQPVKRSAVYAGLYVSITLGLIFSFVAGVGIPGIIHTGLGDSHTATLITLLLVGSCLTAVFVGIAFVLSVRFDDKAKGMGSAILTWLFFAIIYDGLILFVAIWFEDYPLEKAMITMSMLNPIDLGRIILMLKIDIAALMGYTGATFERFFGSMLGIVLSSAILILWSTGPFALGLKRFRGRDF